MGVSYLYDYFHKLIRWKCQSYNGLVPKGLGFTGEPGDSLLLSIIHAYTKIQYLCAHTHWAVSSSTMKSADYPIKMLKIYSLCLLL